jgi:hypothetical protein
MHDHVFASVLRSPRIGGQTQDFVRSGFVEVINVESVSEIKVCDIALEPQRWFVNSAEEVFTYGASIFTLI